MVRERSRMERRGEGRGGRGEERGEEDRKDEERKGGENQRVGVCLFSLSLSVSQHKKNIFIVNRISPLFVLTMARSLHKADLIHHTILLLSVFYVSLMANAT